MHLVQYLAWIMFAAIWVGLVTVAVLVIFMAAGITRSVFAGKSQPAQPRHS